MRRTMSVHTRMTCDPGVGMQIVSGASLFILFFPIFIFWLTPQDRAAVAALS